VLTQPDGSAAAAVSLLQQSAGRSLREARSQPRRDPAWEQKVQASQLL